MLNIPEYRNYSGETKIALMDNSTVAFLEQVERAGIYAKELQKSGGKAHGFNRWDECLIILIFGISMRYFSVLDVIIYTAQKGETLCILFV